MDIRLFPKEKFVGSGIFPIPCATAAAVIEKLRSLCIEDDFQGFQIAMGSENFEIIDLHDVMIEAIQKDRVEFASLILSYGFPIAPCYTQEATVYRAKGVIESFLKAGWDINQPVDHLKPPVLCYAVTDFQMTTWLLKHGASPNTRCDVDCTPLSYAVRNAHPSVIELLLNHGGDVKKGQVLQYAVSREEQLEEVISRVVDRGAPLNGVMYEDGPTLMRFFPLSLGTALHVATERGKANAIRHLIHLGADTAVKDANGDTALEWAWKWDETEMVRLLEDLESHS